MKNPKFDQSELTDEELDFVYKRIRGGQPIDIEFAGGEIGDNIARAKAAIEMIERVRDQAQEATPRADETLGEKQQHFPQPEKSLPENVGRFKVKHLIGKGGFGFVLLAHDPNLGRDVALKIPRPETILTPELKSRFVLEGRSVAALAHPNIVHVYESGQIGSVCYIASTFVDGKTLADLLVENPKGVAPELAARIVLTLADAIFHAHQRNVLHRDIKPSNILVATEPAATELSQRVCITDFGLAKNVADADHQTRSGALVGTPAYMSPEQAQQKPAIPQSDLYSIGSVFYELLTGQTPFEGGNILSMIQAVIKKEPVAPRKLNPAIPKDLVFRRSLVFG